MTTTAAAPSAGTGSPVCGDGGRCGPLAAEPLGGSAARDFATALKALADPVRLRLVSMIAAHDGGEACVCDLTGPVGLSQPTVSHHLRVLAEAGFVTRSKRGTWAYYALVPGSLEAMAATLGAVGR